MVKATFADAADAIKLIEPDLGAGALRSPEFAVTMGYRDSTKTFGHDYDEAARHELPSLLVCSEQHVSLHPCG